MNFGRPPEFYDPKDQRAFRDEVDRNDKINLKAGIFWKSKALWTPVFTAATPPSGVTYGTQYGDYRVLGDIVLIRARLVLTNKGSLGSGAIKITGLPFQSDAVACALALSDWDLINLSTNYTAPGASVPGSSSHININESGDNVSGQAVTWANCSNTSAFAIVGTYFRV